VPIYTYMPTKDQWKRDLGLSTVFGNFKSPFPAMERLGKLIAAWHEVPGVGIPRRLAQVHLTYLMYRQCEFVMKNNGKGFFHSREKMGGQLNNTQLGAVRALHTYVADDLMDFLGCQRWEFNSELMNTFGRVVTDHSRQEDEMFLGKGMLDWYQSDVERQCFKLSFREGLANKWDYIGRGKGKLRIYDTDASGDALEFGGSLYVLDQRGRIYATGQIEMNLKHSSFMAGQATQCAGTMRVERGKIVWVSGRSGHYQPTVAQLVNLLERLSSYQVDLSRVTVYRENYTKEFPGSAWLNFEGCKASDLLVQRAWPTGFQPMSMRVA